MWVEKIYENLFEKILPLKKGMSLEFYDAAIFGYAFSSLKRELASKLIAWKKLPEQTDKEKDKKENEREVYEWLRQQYEPTLDSIRRRMDSVLADWKLAEVADYLGGFAYGVECQQREEGWTPSANTETLQIYKAMLRHQSAMENFIKQRKTARGIAEYIAEKATVQGGATTHAKRYFWTNRDKDGKEIYLKTFGKICERIHFPLPPRGGHHAPNPTPEN